MIKKLTTPRFVFITTAIFIAAISRLLPHLPNFTPVAAMALFGGVYLTDKRLAFIIPLLSMLLSDVFIGFHNTIIYVYISFMLTSLIGLLIRTKLSFVSVMGASIFSSLLFFFITNFGVWAEMGFQNGSIGLTETYVLGIPFFAPTIIGDLLYNSILFGVFVFAQKKYPVLKAI